MSAFDVELLTKKIPCKFGPGSSVIFSSIVLWLLQPWNQSSRNPDMFKGIESLHNPEMLKMCSIADELRMVNY